MPVGQAIQAGLHRAAQRAVVDAAGRLVEHGQQRPARRTPAQPRPQEGCGDAVEHHHVRALAARLRDHRGRSGDCQREVPFGEGHKLDPGVVLRRQLRHPQMIEIAPGQRAGIAERQ